MARNPDTWWDLNDFLDLHDQAEAEQADSRARHGAWFSEGLSVVSIDDLIADDADL